MGSRPGGRGPVDVVVFVEDVDVAVTAAEADAKRGGGGGEGGVIDDASARADTDALAAPIKKGRCVWRLA